MTFSKHLLSLGLCLSMTACIGSKKETSSDNGETTNSDAETSINASFRVESVSVVNVSHKGTDALGLAKQKLYNFSACVQDKVMRAPIIFTQFAVSDGKKERPVRTDANGCLLWSETHEMNFAQPETLFEISRTFLGKDTYEGSVTINLAFNPWNDSEAILDLRKQTPVQAPQKVQSFGFDANPMSLQTYDRKFAPTAYAADIKLEFLGLDTKSYKIDEALNLTVAHKYRIHMNPTIARWNINNKMQFDSISEGAINLKLIFVRAEADKVPKQTDVITTLETELLVDSLRDGPKAYGDVSLTIPNMAMVASRMRVLVQVSPSKSLSLSHKIEPGFFEGNIVPLKGNDASLDLIPAKIDVADSVSTLLAPVEKKPFLFSNLLNKNYGLRTPDLSPVDLRYIDTSRLHNSNYDFKSAMVKMVDGKLSGAEQNLFMKALCLKVFPTKTRPEDFRHGGFFDRLFGAASERPTEIDTHLYRCLLNPSKYINLNTKNIVSKINNNQKVTVVGAQRDFNLNIANSFDFSSSKENSIGQSGSISAGFGKGWGSLFTLGISGSIFKSQSRTNSVGTSRSASAGWAESISGTALTFQFNATYRQCLIFSPKAEFQTSEVGSDENI